jgi:hypothetical protein
VRGARCAVRHYRAHTERVASPSRVPSQGHSAFIIHKPGTRFTLSHHSFTLGGHCTVQEMDLLRGPLAPQATSQGNRLDAAALTSRSHGCCVCVYNWLYVAYVWHEAVQLFDLHHCHHGPVPVPTVTTGQWPAMSSLTVPHSAGPEPYSEESEAAGGHREPLDGGAGGSGGGGAGDAGEGPGPASTSGRRELLCLFVHRLLNFRREEVEAVVALEGIAPQQLRWRRPAGEVEVRMRGFVGPRRVARPLARA